MLAQDAIPIRKPGYQCSDEDGQLSIRDSEKEAVSTLNATAMLIWDLCDGHSALSEIEARLVGIYPESATEIQNDIDNVITGLYEGGAITLSAVPSGHTFDWRSEAQTRASFHCNVGYIAEEVLQERGWRPARGNEVAGFSIWAPLGPAPRTGFIQAMDKWETTYLDDKIRLYQALMAEGAHGIMPNTWLDIDQFANEADTSSGNVWLIKESGNTWGRGTYCYNRLDDIRARAKQISSGEFDYIIQESVGDEL